MQRSMGKVKMLLHFGAAEFTAENVRLAVRFTVRVASVRSYLESSYRQLCYNC